MGYLTVRLGEEQKELRERWRRAAEAEGMSLSAWVRRALIRQAEREKALRETEPQRKGAKP